MRVDTQARVPGTGFQYILIIIITYLFYFLFTFFLGGGDISPQIALKTDLFLSQALKCLEYAQGTSLLSNMYINLFQRTPSPFTHSRISWREKTLAFADSRGRLLNNSICPRGCVEIMSG